MFCSASVASFRPLPRPRLPPSVGYRPSCRSTTICASGRGSPPPDWLSGGKEFSREVLLAFEQADGSFGPRVFAAGGLAIGLLGSLPVSIGDVVRAHASTDSLGVLAANSGLAALACWFIASNVRGRTEKLERLANELVLGDLKVVKTDRFGNDKLLTLRELRSFKRIAVLYGTVEKLERDLAAAQIYRARLSASNIVVVPVAVNAPGVRVKPPTCTVSPSSNKSWFIWPTPGGGFDADSYFQKLLGKSACDAEEGAYITLGLDGRVRGSGVGSPNWDVLLSTFPQQLLDRAGMELYKEDSAEAKKDQPTKVGEAESDETIEELRRLHTSFYTALGSGDVSTMSKLWRQQNCDAISSYVDRGAAMDGWETVLREDRRPVGMTATDPDFLVSPDGREAWCTSVETVAGGSTLLATQHMELTDSGEWLLTGHQTIPYGKDIIAKVLLTCDARGCVALPAKAVASSVSMKTFKLK